MTLKQKLRKYLDRGICIMSVVFLKNAESLNVVKSAITISKEIGSNWIGTDHLLLGLLKDTNSLPCRCLEKIGITFDKVCVKPIN